MSISLLFLAARYFSQAAFENWFNTNRINSLEENDWGYPLTLLFGVLISEFFPISAQIFSMIIAIYKNWGQLDVGINSSIPQTKGIQVITPYAKSSLLDSESLISTHTDQDYTNLKSSEKNFMSQNLVFNANIIIQKNRIKNHESEDYYKREVLSDNEDSYNPR
eukprot:CAMPEP_0170543556 /NCGR_PEP_ID=MMETSP0211-20121228/2637_1 /TAXON_ID=311385 /ORGANISM="Pseudokeronopsis sp., Strain OXSARD2" /LENGTH=163 /DNA_ID=CAMNT_0010846965 /DNA_START=683 /DNA_END=1174 /DNA_ORIENTATION=-